MAYAGAIMMGAGTVMGAYSSYEAGKQQQAVDEYNAKVADSQASDAMARGEVTVNDLRRDARRISGAQRASLAAQGIALDDGSAAAAIDDTERQVVRDINTARLNTAREAWGFKVQATSSRTSGKLARRAGTLNATGQLIGGAGKTAELYSDANYRGKGV
jgi:hypothetical protein